VKPAAANPAISIPDAASAAARFPVLCDFIWISLDKKLQSRRSMRRQSFDSFDAR